MAKDIKEKKYTESEEEKIAKARKKRLALAAEQIKVVEDNSNAREEFRKFFVKIKKQLNLNNSLEHVIWLHLKAINHDKKELFEAGLKHFGYNL